MVEQPPHPLSFLTYNVFADLPQFSYLERRLEIQAMAIAAHRPDVVALQELVRAKECGDIGTRLCDLVNRRLGAPIYVLHHTVADGAGEGEWAFDEGIGLLTCHPLTAEVGVLKFKAQVRLSTRLQGIDYRLPDDRVAIHARFKLQPKVAVDIYATHLTDRADSIDGKAVRALQARELAEWIEATSEPGNLVLLGGDLNDRPDSHTIRTLTDHGLIDLHAAAAGEPGFTNDSNDLDLLGALNTSNQRIDYVFMRPPVTGRWAIRSVELFLDQPHPTLEHGWLWASDHFGVLAHLEIS